MHETDGLSPQADSSGAVVIGGRLPALSTVRALGSRGVRVAVVATKPYQIAQYSRWVTERHTLLHNDNAFETLLEFLEKKRRHWEGWALFATDDEALEVLSVNRQSLSRHYRVIAPPYEVTRQLLRKDLLCRLAGELGVETPHCYGPASRALVDRTEIRYPVVVKPVESHRFVERFGRKLFAAHDRTDLLAHVDAVEDAGLEAEIFDLVPGPDDRFYNYSVYLDRRGRVLGELGMRKLRKSPPFFGVCRVAEPANASALREPTLRILKRIGWWGMANAEYKLDPRDGRFRLIEINGRCFLMQGLAGRVGVDYPWIAWRDAVLDEQSNVEPEDWDGIWLNAIDDLYHLLMFRRVEGLSVRDYMRTWSRAKAFAIWSRRDVKPFVAHCCFGVRKAARMVFRPKYRSAVYGRVQPIQSQD